MGYDIVPNIGSVTSESAGFSSGSRIITIEYEAKCDGNSGQEPIQIIPKLTAKGDDIWEESVICMPPSKSVVSLTPCCDLEPSPCYGVNVVYHGVTGTGSAHVKDPLPGEDVICYRDAVFVKIDYSHPSLPISVSSLDAPRNLGISYENGSITLKYHCDGREGMVGATVPVEICFTVGEGDDATICCETVLASYSCGRGPYSMKSMKINPNPATSDIEISYELCPPVFTQDIGDMPVIEDTLVIKDPGG
jgi:hypothetical protein